MGFIVTPTAFREQEGFSINMSNSDFAILFYIEKWLIATKGMKADCKGWYLNLILYQYKKGFLPDDIEELANYADVRVSEYEKFTQMWSQVLSQKFTKTENGTLKNDFADQILINRETFKDKRSQSGILGNLIKIYKSLFKDADYKEIAFIKKNIDINKINLKDTQMCSQMCSQLRALFINRDININNTINVSEILKPEILKTGLSPNKDKAKEIWNMLTDEQQNKYKEGIKDMFKTQNKWHESVAKAIGKTDTKIVLIHLAEFWILKEGDLSYPWFEGFNRLTGNYTNWINIKVNGKQYKN